MLLPGSGFLLFVPAQLQVGRVTEPGYGLSLSLSLTVAALCGCHWKFADEHGAVSCLREPCTHLQLRGDDTQVAPGVRRSRRTEGTTGRRDCETLVHLFR